MDQALRDYNKALADFTKSLPPGLLCTSFDPLRNSANAADAIAASKDLDSKLASVLDRRHFAKAHPAVKKRVEDLQKYAPVIDTFVASNPAVAALVWGSIKLVLQSIVQFLNPFEKVFDAFHDIANTLPRIEIYQKYATTLPSIEAALAKFHINLVKFFAASLKFLKRHGIRALLASLGGTLDPNFEEISRNLKEDAHQLDLLVSAVAFDAASEERSRQTRRAFFQWLNAEQENDKRYDLAKALVHPGTCSWIQESKEYRKWAEGLRPDFITTNEDDPCPVLEVHGQEGCGKTVLAAWLAQTLGEQAKDKKKTAFAYYFHDSGGLASRDNCSILTCLIAQILRNHIAVSDADIVRQFEASCNTVASEKECYKILQSLVQHFDSIVILIDSRYSDYQAKAYEILCRLMGKTRLECLDSTRVARTNGTQPGILLKAISFLAYETHGWPCSYRPKSTEVLQLDHHTQAKDEESYVSSQAQAISSIHFEAQGPEWLLLNEKIKTQLCREPRAHFLLLKLMVEYLKVQISPREVEVALNSLSPDVRSIYQKAFERIQKFEDSRTQLGFNVLQWVAFGLRSLHVSELAEGVVIRTGDRALDPAKRPSRLENQIRQICGPFVSISDGFVHPSHVSAKYFLQDVVVDESNPNTDAFTLRYFPVHEDNRRGYNPKGFEAVSRNRITRACIAYLSLDTFSQQPNLDRSKQIELHPFSEYAVHCWLHHILLLANVLKNPEKGYRLELAFDRDLLELISSFLSRPQSWTYLQSLVVFSSVREALETLQSHMWPIRELGPIMQHRGGPNQKGLESDDAGVLELWMKKAIGRLESVQNLPIEIAMNELKAPSRSLNIVLSGGI